MIVICRGADFSANTIRTVVVKETSSITINGDSSVTGMMAQLTSVATFKDGTTATITPIWSILSGSQYATIDDEGLVTISPSANNSQVVISAEYDGKTATKTMTLTYDFAFTLNVNVSDFEHYCGVANSIQNDGKASSPDSGVYSCIIPAQSGKSLVMKLNNTTIVNGATTNIDGVDYVIKCKIFGFNEQRYATDGDATGARMNSAGTSCQIFDGFWSGASAYVPTMPYTIPYQYNEQLTAKDTNIPYICIVVRFDQSNGTRLFNLKNYASQINLQYIIS